MSEYIPVQAQIPENNLFLAQATLPYLYDISATQQPLTELQQIQSVEFNQYNQPSQGRKYSQNNPDFDRYFVYVDSSNSQMLQQVRQIESSAYIRNYNGRNVIQSGVFNGQSNAQRRVRELEFNGIPGARIVNSNNIEVTSSSPQVIIDNSTVYNPQNYTNNFQEQRSKYYYIVIPGNANNLRSLGTEIRQKVNININVFRRNQPRGPHIAVGPFSDKLEAEQWNSYLKNSGYGNARVYYGK
ncbi:hypothetical protein [Anabaena sp. UHCC 0187]|uniref:hypothetical protein n=1 Tax=Anabaena sp. UHCC 0187 TaxID=2590018 RepID=UPI0020C3A0C8|nr:hypothetical protein [Anabaena sp. UHCC 0187]